MMVAVLECVMNVSEGRDARVIDAIAAAGGSHVLDVHRDPWHHRSVLTLGGSGVEAAARAVARTAVEHIDLATHDGVHPRVGAVDVVPFVPLHGSVLRDALVARDVFARWLAGELGVPSFLYGPERSLPEVRRRARAGEAPDVGGPQRHRRAGATCAGARDVLVAYNLWLATPDLALARSVASAIRSPGLRALAFAVGDHVQVSCNLIEPARLGPHDVYDAVAARAPVARAELVGLIPRDVLERAPADRWGELDLDPSRTIEARLEQAGLDGGSEG